MLPRKTLAKRKCSIVAFVLPVCLSAWLENFQVKILFFASLHEYQHTAINITTVINLVKVKRYVSANSHPIVWE